MFRKMTSFMGLPFHSERHRYKHRVGLITLAFVGLLLCLEGAKGATANRKTIQSVTPSITSSSNSKSRRVMEPAFENAGKKPGLEIWRIENFKPVAYSRNDYGKFYTGDSYIVLSTKETKGVLSWNIHFWLGQQTSQDESGAAAILSVQLDDQLGGAPVQYREVQEHESQLFLSYFKNGVRYLPGGVNSGFTHVDPNNFEKKLFQIKGKRNIRVKQVDLTIAAMNKGDCFILDTGRNIYVYIGTKSKRVERLKAISAANQIRDQDHAGRAKVHVIDESSTEDEIQEFFDQLGSGSPADVPDESAGGDDNEFETQQENIVTLHRVSDSNGPLMIQKIAQKPLQQSMLDTNDCFILDTTDSNIFVWVGKKCNNKEKSEAMNKAQTFLTNNHYPSWTQVQRVVEGAESSIFKQYFQTWKSAGELHARLIRSVDEPSRLIMKSSGELPEFMPDDGTGHVETYRIEDFELAPVTNFGKFFGGDSYIVKYNYGNNKWIIYIWQGKNSSIDEKAASAIHAIQIDNELGGAAVQIRVVQDHEPKHFLHIFKGKLVTFLGGHASGFKNIRDHDTYVEGETRLYRIRGTSEEDVRASQKDATASSLQSDDVFIVENDQNVWIWHGKDSDEIERALANGFVEQICPDGPEPVVITEEDEPDEFWEALGGKTEYKESFIVDAPEEEEPRLFHAELGDNRKLKVEEIHDFTQRDLDEDDVMIVDTKTKVYIWLGSGSTEEERKQSIKTVMNYLEKYDRDDTLIVTIHQGEEPESFTSLFPSWDPDLWETMTSYSDAKEKLREQNNEIESD